MGRRVPRPGTRTRRGLNPVKSGAEYCEKPRSVKQLTSLPDCDLGQRLHHKLAWCAAAGIRPSQANLAKKSFPLVWITCEFTGRLGTSLAIAPDPLSTRLAGYIAATRRRFVEFLAVVLPGQASRWAEYSREWSSNKGQPCRFFAPIFCGDYRDFVYGDLAIVFGTP
jgi:hypothetical protein